jgi:hypothetical protein
MKCAACSELLRGKRAIPFDGKPVCASPCGALVRVKKPFSYGALDLTGPELLRLFILEASRWRTP